MASETACAVLNSTKSYQRIAGNPPVDDHEGWVLAGTDNPIAFPVTEFLALADDSMNLSKGGLELIDIRAPVHGHIDGTAR